MTPTTAAPVGPPQGSIGSARQTLPGGPALPRPRTAYPTNGRPGTGVPGREAGEYAPESTVTFPQPNQPVDAEQAAEQAPEHGDEASGGWTLVKAAQDGDMAAFGELFDRYYDVVFRFVLFRVGDRTLAEDIASETFVRGLRRISSVSYMGRDIGAWFITIARNLIFDHVKSSRYRLEQATSDIIELSPSTNGPEQQVLDGATNEELLRCVRKLNPDQQECIQLRFLQGLSVAETAQIMDRNEGAVKALQHRAVRRLAQLLPEGLR
jgi:RNA polymerase sigma-70 factor (ECF subfamily)